MVTPFSNDMFAMVYEAFKNLYPEKNPLIQWTGDSMTADDGKNILGLTSYGENGEIFVDISAYLTVADAVEILVHELAHVAVGADVESHGKEWEAAFDAIHAEFIRIGDEKFGEGGESVNVMSGKDYVRERERNDQSG